ncbi:FAD-dependent oxidoreductase [Ramlibacter sp.]|uniref:NAD(P)/FAD-dependent oxidoreductase n=1 Tax=Ramlibacter sp. TaxID=1917967 RepID=UPI001825C6E0|nr:FAD-dependent oxidoreductase [Ramlibacter sp.]MBA2673282.1 FAD-dependent oxidoreductase [Ramlibacter sp.]
MMDIVIVGGGYAGVACAARLAHRARAQRTPARIRLINPQPRLIERIRLHQAAAGQPLPERRIDTLLDRCGVELVTGYAEALDPSARTLRVGGQALGWDRLVLALGSAPNVDAVPGVAAHAFTLGTDAVAALHARLAALPQGACAAVVGGGLTGIEAASEIAEAFPRLRVHLVAHGAIGPDFGPAGRRHVLDTLAQRLGVTLHEHVRVDAVGATRLETGQGPLAFDACVWAAGFTLPTLPREAGLRTNARGQVLVDPQLRSVSHPWIYAAGDVAGPALPPGQELPMGCKTAMPMGVHVGDNLAGELMGQACNAFDYALLFYCVSLGRRDGLVPWADAEGRLTGRVLTGRRAAWFKEMICRSTWWGLMLEARGHKAVVWKRTGRAPQSLAPA